MKVMKLLKNSHFFFFCLTIFRSGKSVAKYARAGSPKARNRFE
jgi:hypothetical protein